MHIGLRNTLFEGPLQISSSQKRTLGCDDISIAEVEQLRRSKIVFTINLLFIYYLFLIYLSLTTLGS